MGNKSLAPPSRIPKAGNIVKIVHDEFSEFQDIPDNILRTGQIAQVLSTTVLHQSNPNAPKIYVCKIKFKDGYTNVYFVKNLEIIK